MDSKKLLETLQMSLAQRGAEPPVGLIPQPQGANPTADLERSAAWGNPAAQHKLGMTYLAGLKEIPRNPAKAIEWLRKAADQGHIAAALQLGWAYWKGANIPNDMNQATMWLRLAAEGGEPTAQHTLGEIYFSGRDVPQDYAEAAKWYALSAAQGDGESNYKLGIMYRDGLGVPQDSERSNQYLEAYVDSENMSSDDL